MHAHLRSTNYTEATTSTSKLRLGPNYEAQKIKATPFCEPSRISYIIPYKIFISETFFFIPKYGAFPRLARPQRGKIGGENK